MIVNSKEDNNLVPSAVMGDLLKPFGKLEIDPKAADMEQIKFFKHTFYTKDTIDHARDDTTKKHKHGDKPSLNKHGQDPAGQVHDDIKKVDPNNIAGAIPPFLDIMKKLLNNTDPMNALKGMVGGDMYGMLQNVLSMMASDNASGTVSNQPKPGDPCMIDETHPGTLQFNANTVLICVSNSTSNGISTHA